MFGRIIDWLDWVFLNIFYSSQRYWALSVNELRSKIVNRKYILKHETNSDLFKHTADMHVQTISCDTLHVHPDTHTNWFDMSVNVVQDELTECDKQIEFECVFATQGQKTGYEHTWCTHPPACTHKHKPALETLRWPLINTAIIKHTYVQTAGSSQALHK